MELYDVMRTTFAAREFTADPLPDEVLYRILDNARFAPSGGNRQGGHVLVIRSPRRGRRWRRSRCPARSATSRSSWPARTRGTP